ncbi:MAG TPA: hypothetical protein VGM41_14130 [Chitinophagaceae bacterium]
MSAHFQEDTRQPAVNYPPPVRFIGHFFSVLFHPMFIPAYITAYLVFVDNYAYADFTYQGKLFRLISVFDNTAFLPVFCIFLTWRLKFIDSIFLRTRKDRIIPYIICMTFYFWAWYTSRNFRGDNGLHDSPELTAMLLGIFIASIVGMMANIYFKISMHGLAAGILLVFFAWLVFNGSQLSGALLPVRGFFALAVFISGLMLTARFIVSNHDAREIYIGFFAGALCQLIAIVITG